MIRLISKGAATAVSPMLHVSAPLLFVICVGIPSLYWKILPFLHLGRILRRLIQLMISTRRGAGLSAPLLFVICVVCIGKSYHFSIG